MAACVATVGIVGISMLPPDPRSFLAQVTFALLGALNAVMPWLLLSGVGKRPIDAS